MVQVCILITGIVDLECSRQRLIHRIINLQNVRDIRLEIENYRLALKDKNGGYPAIAIMETRVSWIRIIR